MNTKNYMHILKDKWQVVALTATILLLLTVIISLLQPFEYRARVGMLVIQKQTASLDAYAAARASERLALGLGNVVESESFFYQVVDTNPNINIDWPQKQDKKRQAWKRMISFNVSAETGILNIDVYAKDKDQAKMIAGTIAHVLTNKSAEYHGGGDSVIIKVIDPALVSNYPVRPNIILNVFAALVLGIILSTTAVIFLSQKQLIETGQEEAEKEFSQPDQFDENINYQGKIKSMLDHNFDNQEDY